MQVTATLRVGLVACGVRGNEIFWETTSGFIPIFSAIWFDSGYMSAVYETGFAGDIAPGAVFLRGFQALMRCIMAGMDQQEQFVAPYRKLQKFRSCSYCGRLHPCRCGEFIPWSRQFVRPGISQLLHMVVNVLVARSCSSRVHTWRRQSTSHDCTRCGFRRVGQLIFAFMS